MNQQEGNIWYPQLPEGYSGQQNETRYYNSYSQQHYPHNWQGGYPGQQNWPQQPSRPNYPGYPAPPDYPGYPGQHTQRPNYPGQQGGHPAPHRPQQPGYPNYPGGPGVHRPHQPGYPGQNPQQEAPSSPPPGHIPEYPDARLRAVDPGGIAGCLYRYTYVWTSRTNGFWYYPTFVGRKSIAGYRWSPQHYRWEYFGIDLKHIDAFRCT